MSSKPELRCDFVAYEAAKASVLRWHYSRHMPTGKLVNVGVWEGSRFIGVVIFGRGCCPHIGDGYDLSQDQVCELVRVALDRHECFTSRVVALALRLLKTACPGLRLVVSYADMAKGHHGGIYQAGGWVYVGTITSPAYVVHGKKAHNRSLNAKYGKVGNMLAYLRRHVDPNATRYREPPRHKYLMPLDKAMRRQLEPLKKPYPKSCVGSADSGTPGNQSGGGGASPTPALQTPSSQQVG